MTKERTGTSLFTNIFLLLYKAKQDGLRASQYDFPHNSERNACLQFFFHLSPLTSNHTYLSSFADFSLLSSESVCPICGNSAFTISGVRVILNSVPSVSLKINKLKNSWLDPFKSIFLANKNESMFYVRAILCFCLWGSLGTGLGTSIQVFKK